MGYAVGLEINFIIIDDVEHKIRRKGKIANRTKGKRKRNRALLEWYNKTFGEGDGKE